MRSRITVIPAVPEHLAQMQLRAAVSVLPAYLVHAFTVLEDGVPLCMWGITPLWPGVGSAWFLERQVLAEHPAAKRIARAVWQTWTQHCGEFRYVEAFVLEGRADSQRLLEWLGFEPVCCKPGYGPAGETFVEYQWRGTYGD
jgi:hypothetical protein